MANYLDPYASELQGIQRQQKLAEMLMNQPQPQEQMVSGRVAPINPLQAFLPALNTYQGMNLQKNAEADTKKLADLVRGERQNELKNISNLTFGSEDYNPAIRPDIQRDDMGNIMPNVQEQVGSAPNIRKAYDVASMSQNPQANALASALYGQLTKQPDIKEVAQGGSLVGVKNGVVTPLYTNPAKEEKPPVSYQEYLLAQRDGFKGSYNDYQTLDANRKRPVTNVTTNVSTGKAYGSQFGDLIAKQDIDKYTIAETAPKILEQSNQIKTLIKNGALTGTGSDFVLSAAKVFNVVGVDNAETIKNTELLVSNLGQNVLNNIKTSGLGTGQGFTDKDRVFLERVVGGQTKLDKTTLLELANLQERAARASVNKWNDRTKTIPPEVLQATGIGAITLPTISNVKTENTNKGTPINPTEAFMGTRPIILKNNVWVYKDTGKAVQ